MSTRGVSHMRMKTTSLGWHRADTAHHACALLADSSKMKALVTFLMPANEPGRGICHQCCG